MNPKQKLLGATLRCLLAIVCTIALLPGDTLAFMSSSPSGRASSPQDEAAKIPNDQLDSLVAPIALYPDPLLAQVLASSTYPLELVQLQQWLEQHKDLKDKALADAVQKEDWDPSVQSMAALPDVVKNLVENIKWTTDLGNAFLAQQSDVMDAIQRMRKKAQDKGALKSNEQIKVETKTVESQTVVVVEQANPQVVYVPSYDPVVVYGPPVYPYPTGYYVAGMALSFGVGLAMGAMWSGGWGYGCGWGGNNNININNNNNFNRNSNISGGNRPSNQPARGGGNRGQGGQGSWKHNPQHRGGTPYSNKATADRFGGTTRGSSQAARQNSARQNVGRQQAAGKQFGGSGGRGGAGGGQAGGRPSQGQLGAGRGGAGGAGSADRVGNRSVSQGGGARGSGAGGFGGSGRSSSGSGARASSSRGASSMGGGSRGGGGRGGGGGRRR